MNVLKLLRTNGFIQVNKELGRKIGLHEALVLGELCSIANMFNFQEFYFQQDKLAYETILSVKQVRDAVNNLKEKGILTVTKKGIPCKNWYFLHSDIVASYFDSDEEDVTNCQTSYANSAQLDTQNLSDTIGKNCTTVCAKSEAHLKDNIKDINKDIREKDKREISQNENQIQQEEFSTSEIPLSYDLKKIYTEWVYHKLPVRSEIEFRTRFKDAIQFLRKNYVTTTDDLLKAIKNYATEKNSSEFLQNLNWNFTAFASKIEKFLPEYYKQGCYQSFNQKEKIDYSDPYWQEKENAKKQKALEEARQKKEAEIRTNGYKLPEYTKDGKKIYRNALNQPLKENGYIDLCQLSNELKDEEKYCPEKFNERQKLLVLGVGRGFKNVPEELMSFKL